MRTTLKLSQVLNIIVFLFISCICMLTTEHFIYCDFFPTQRSVLSLFYYTDINNDNNKYVFDEEAVNLTFGPQ